MKSVGNMPPSNPWTRSIRNMPPSNTWTRAIRKSEQFEVKEDLGKTFKDAWMSRMDGFTEDQEEEADKEQHKDDQRQEHENKMTSRSGPVIGYP